MENNILEDLVDYLKPKAHDAIDAIKNSWNSMIEQQNTWKELGYDAVESKSMLEDFLMDPINIVPLNIPARGLWKFLRTGKKIPRKTWQPSELFQWPKITTTAKAKETIKNLGFRNVDEFEDWMIIKSESDKAFAKSIGKEQVDYFKYLKKLKKQRKAEKLLPRNISFEDMIKTKNPIETYKKALKAGNPRFYKSGGNKEAAIKEYLRKYKSNDILSKIEEGTKIVK